MVGNFNKIEINITDLQKININISHFCLLENTFVNNTASLGGAALRINGFYVSEVTNNYTNGSCF